MRITFHKTKPSTDRWVVRRMVGGKPHEYLRLTEWKPYRWTKNRNRATLFMSPEFAQKEIEWSELAWHDGVRVYKF